MDFALSTNWHSARHAAGETLVDEALALGFAGLELGYGFTPPLAAGVRRRAAAGAVRVVSVHAFCPVPLGAPAGHPELYLAADTDEDMRRLAVIHLLQTLDFAVAVGAPAVVAHAGRIPAGGLSQRLAERHRDAATADWRYRRLRRRLLGRRRRRAGRHLAALRRSLDELTPAFIRAGVTLCLENLPSWDAVPNEEETEVLLAEYPPAALRYWHDTGHGQVRENLGFINHAAAARRLLPLTRGVHVHDVAAPSRDHLPPGAGEIDFAALAFLAAPGLPAVLEPAPGTPAGEVARGLETIGRLWRRTPPLSAGA
jgi:sugar phosphate isomerase/epimerase